MTGVADLAQHREAVETGHHHVEQHGIEAAGDELREPGVTGARMHDRDALGIEISIQELREAGVVVDKEHAHGIILSHAVRAAATFEPATVEHFGELLALTVVEHGVDVAKRFEDRGARGTGGLIDAAQHRAERRIIERGVAEGSGEITARIAHAPLRIAEAILQLLDLRDDRALLGGRAVETVEHHVETPTTYVTTAVVPVAPGRTETSVVGVVMVMAASATSCDETEEAEAECEANHGMSFRLSRMTTSCVAKARVAVKKPCSDPRLGRPDFGQRVRDPAKPDKRL